MNREIKFRAWTEKNKIMIYEGWNNDSFVSKREIFAQGDDASIMQFTGLLDKNGKDIYEGDIVRNESRTWQEEDGEAPTYSKEVSSIVYRNHGFWVDVESFGWEGESLWNWDEIKVLGNIYQNPELLESVKK